MKFLKTASQKVLKKILKTKYLLGLQNLKSINSENINEDLNNASHAELSEKLYANAITLLKDEKKSFAFKS